jgi:hypothetical protein
VLSLCTKSDVYFAVYGMDMSASVDGFKLVMLNFCRWMAYGIMVACLSVSMSLYLHADSQSLSLLPEDLSYCNAGWIVEF